jgi:hypothetical protein
MDIMCLERPERNVNEGARMTYLCHPDIEKIDWTADVTFGTNWPRRVPPLMAPGFCRVEMSLVVAHQT